MKTVWIIICHFKIMKICFICNREILGQGHNLWPLFPLYSNPDCCCECYDAIIDKTGKESLKKPIKKVN